MSVTFAELNGDLVPGTLTKAGAAGHVVLSSLRSGSSETAPQKRVGIKYVVSGRETYRFGSTSYNVSPGSFLVVPEQQPGEAAIRREDGTAIGLCVYLPEATILGSADAGLEAPLTFATECTALGRLLTGTMQEMRRAPHQRPEAASRLISAIGGSVEELLCDAQRQMAGLDAVKVSTRYETLRRVNVARAFLHGVTGRPVDLAELAREAGMSRFHLLRHFRDIVGEPPAAHHRRLRLELARRDIEARSASCTNVAHRYGFADASSFSHAYRRAFGEAPARARGPR